MGEKASHLVCHYRLDCGSLGHRVVPAHFDKLSHEFERVDGLDFLCVSGLNPSAEFVGRERRGVDDFDVCSVEILSDDTAVT